MTPAQLFGLSLLGSQLGENSVPSHPWGVSLCCATHSFFEPTGGTRRSKIWGAFLGESKECFGECPFNQSVVAQFFYAGAQVGVTSSITRFAESEIAGTNEKTASHYLQLHMLGFMIERFVVSAITKKVAAPKPLSIFTSGALLSFLVVLLAWWRVPVWAIVLVAFFHSIMFPTTSALSLKDPGPHNKLGSSLLVMLIIGGAVIPVVMGQGFGRRRHPDCFCNATHLPRLHFVFRFAWLQTGARR